MAKTTREKLIELFQSQAGYKEEKSKGNNWTKYSRWFDNEAWQWFNTKKQGAEWCSIFVCWCLCQASVGIGKNEVLKLLGIPSVKNNCAAAVPYLWDYLTAKGYRVDKSKGQPGDIIIFNNKKHVGYIEKVSGNTYGTMEGNKGDYVARGSYSKNSSYITGIFHLPLEKYDKVEVPEPVAEPTPEPITTPTAPGTIVSEPVDTPVLTSEKIDALAREVIKGKYGNYPEREKKLNALGYGNIYSKVQSRVNEILKGNSAPAQSTPVATPEPSTAGEYEVIARGGLYLRKNPPSNTTSTTGVGATIVCMNYGGTFVEQKRSNKWSYGTYKGKSGWACNIYLKKK